MNKEKDGLESDGRIDSCCLDFKKAREPGMGDNREKAAIIPHLWGFEISHRLPKINYCPWCGKYLG